MSRELTHMMLVANAGSGKTYSLTTRMVALLTRGVAPRKIAALTFTKKAAGEFLDAVFVRLATAAEDPAKLDKLRSDTGLQTLDAAQCRAILRTLVAQMGGLCMGTIDSLFARIARAFPFESGLSGDFAILGDQTVDAAREDALAALFRTAAENDAGFRDFVDNVRQQSRKLGERDVFKTLLDAVGRLHAQFLATPPGVVWGDRKAIWPGSSAIFSAGSPRAAAEAFLQAVKSTHPELPEEAQAALAAPLELARALRPGDSWPKELTDFVKSKLCSQPKSGHLQILKKKVGWVELNPVVESARTALLRALLRQEFESLLRRSAALHGLMARFEDIYDKRTRGQGLMTFDDIKDLLARQVDDPGWRAAAGYRLDARFDHWLLDEFQDTSRSQWKVLSSFIDEVVQDTGNDRTLFYVGDTKQAIYLWRGGDPKLFFDIRDHYNRGGGEKIIADKLDESFRSTREIIDTVNAVFGDPAAVQEDLALPDQAVEDWKMAWRQHEVTPGNAGKQGYVRWVACDEAGSADADEDDAADTASPQDLEILGILQEVEPWKRRWSCAVLKRSNKQVAALAAQLQSAGIPVAVEGKSNPCTDNPLGAALMAALRFAASPGDTLAGTLFAGSPLADPLLLEGELKFREATLRSIALDGYARTVRNWLQPLDVPPFLAARAEAFLAAASAFDADRKPGDGLFEFLDFIGGYQIQEAESTDVVRVMTVHQAKGLTFDMAVVSGLDSRNNDRSAGTLALGGAGLTSWGILLPQKMLCEQDDTLNRARESLLAESAYGELCTAYVAMTRPRFGLYLVTGRLKEDSKAKGFARLLGLTLGQADPYFENGNAKWFERNPAEAAGRDITSTVEPESDFLPPERGTPRPVAPSSLEKAGETADPAGGISLEAGNLGTEVHRALAKISWLDEGKPAFAGCSTAAKKLLNAFIGSEVARQIFSKPAPVCTLWREQAFDVMADGQWVSGIFDRVHVFRNPDGTPASATVYDFKTDKAPAGEIVTRYAPQMTSYRKAAAALLGLQESLVTVRTVPVR